MTPDMVTGTFEALASLFICLSIHKLYKDKFVAGISYIHVAFFAAWGYWNLYFFPHYELWYSFTGGMFVVLANTIWLTQLLYYTKYPKGRE